MKKLPYNQRLIILLITIFMAVFLQNSKAVPQQPVTQTTNEVLLKQPSATESAHVIRVIDGDTIVLSDNTKVRYIGINSPELNRNECFSKQAKIKNEELVLGKTIIMQKDVSETDRYNRLLRYISLPDGTVVNRELVSQGYAYATSYPPDIALQSDLRAAQTEARENKRGLWKDCEL